jgi:K+-transporting ATPase ATPase B chain
MNTGTSAAKEAGNMVDLDSGPTKLIEIVEIGKQMLISRGGLTTFVALIPLALRGVRYRPCSAAALLRRNLLVYGLGGIVSPFAGIFVIDLLVRLLPGMG